MTRGGSETDSTLSGQVKVMNQRHPLGNHAKSLSDFFHLMDLLTIKRRRRIPYDTTKAYWRASTHMIITLLE